MKFIGGERVKMLRMIWQDSDGRYRRNTWEAQDDATDEQLLNIAMMISNLIDQNQTQMIGKYRAEFVELEQSI